ncbi:NAD(P)H-dependent oxidoreductase subunit E [Altererythrobacter sp. MF3-039]|uniref:NADH-quinone oxidoreductase subunit NuoE family protein n=1 Tax=Altererythrobacter sp. MF3-039 TaxID=3252901 RepID=UPI00390CC043
MSTVARIEEICSAHAGRKGSLLPILHDLQAEFGCISEEAERVVADALNLSRAEVHGVVSFYHDFEQAPDERPQVQICRAEACKARGVEALMPEAEASAGKRVRLQTVYCLGLCSVGPNARVGDAMHSRLDRASIKQLIEAV